MQCKICFSEFFYYDQWSDYLGISQLLQEKWSLHSPLSSYGSTVAIQLQKLSAWNYHSQGEIITSGNITEKQWKKKYSPG